MMQFMDVQDTIDAMKQALLARLGDEVDLIFQYGSRVAGNTHAYSDIDLSFVPAHDTTWDSITVMVGETLADLYPMHWPRLESMAEFRNPSASVLLHHRVVYSRSEAVAGRFAALADRLRSLLRPEARPVMVRRALDIFEGTGYPHYLLRQQAEAGHRLACLQQALAILRTALHSLAVCNQACVDTRKLAQVLTLPLLPEGFAGTVARIAPTSGPGELLEACETLLNTTRDLLLAEQRRALRGEAGFLPAFDAAYPELKRDLQGVMLGCERRDWFAAQSSLMSLHHELSRMLAQALTGVEYTGFNSLAEYEQDLAGLGFPDMLARAAAGDFDGLRRQCLAFDQRLRSFLAERSVPLNGFDTLDALTAWLAAG